MAASNTIRQLFQNTRERGLMHTMKKLFYYDTVKLGTLKGSDEFGNKYFENLDEPYGQHRWVEYNPANFPYDATQVPAEWHVWLHYMFDDTPLPKEALKVAGIENNTGAHTVGAYEGALGGPINASFQPNGTGSKTRTTADGKWDPASDRVYRQPGNPLSERYNKHKAADFVEEFVPADGWTKK